MKHFTIENETNNITVHGSVKEAEAVADSERFGTEAALAKLAVNWPAGRLVEIYNSLPGVTEVKKFKDRATAVSRIWKAIQSLDQVEPVAISEAAAEPATAAEIAESEAALIANQPREVAETVQPEAAIPETTDATPDTRAAPQTPDVAPEEASTKTKTHARRRRPKRPLNLARRARAARPAR